MPSPPDQAVPPTSSEHQPQSENAPAQPYHVVVDVIGDLELETVLVSKSMLNKRNTPVPSNKTTFDPEFRHFHLDAGAWLLRDVVYECLAGWYEPWCLLPENHATQLSSVSVRTYPHSNEKEFLAAAKDITQRIPHSFIEASECKTDPKRMPVIVIQHRYKGTLPTELENDQYDNEYASLLCKRWDNASCRILNKDQASGTKLQCPAFPSFTDEFSVETFPVFTVIDDRAAGFRESNAKDFLRSLAERSQAVFWVHRAPLTKGTLWSAFESLNSELRRKFTIICRETEVIRSGAELKDHGSLERSIAQVVTEWKGSKASVVSRLALAGHLALIFDHGAFHIDTQEDSLCAYNIRLQDSGRPYTQKQFAGEDALITAALVRAAVCDYELLRREQLTSESPTLFQFNVDEGVRLGIKLIELFWLLGYDANSIPNVPLVTREPSPSPYAHVISMWDAYSGWRKNEDVDLALVPTVFQTCHLSRLALALKDEADENACRSSANQLRRYDDLWTLPQNGPKVTSKSDVRPCCFRNATDAGRCIVKHGMKELVDRLTQFVYQTPSRKWVPKINYAMSAPEYGSIVTVMRDEIDAYAGIVNLVKNYLADERRAKPISVAVFGAPGSGKGYVIEQVLASAQMWGKPLRFNVAQFSNPRDIALALHQLQDQALMQDTPPIVFFDEFDCALNGQSMGWLQYFLSPMQDGEFKDGEQVYRIGRAVLIFGGGLFSTYEDFAGLMNTDYKQFSTVKGPDFISRLRGFLNVEGTGTLYREGKRDSIGSEGGNELIIRRACILRQILEGKFKGVIDSVSHEANIDDSVIDLLLTAYEFVHGVRSMEAIVEMSAGIGNAIAMSSIPDQAQRAMHIRSEP